MTTRATPSRLLSALALVGVLWLTLASCGSRGALADGPAAKDAPVPMARTGSSATLSPADIATLAADNHALTFDLYAQLARQSPRANLTFSPHSIAEVMALAYSGARGETAQQMAKHLHFSLPPERLATVLRTLDMQLSAGERTQALPSRVGLRLSDVKDGVKIEEVLRGSPAEKAGLKKGDLLLAVDGLPIRSAADYHAVLAERPGPQFCLEVKFGKNSTVPYWVMADSAPREVFRLAVANALWGRKGLAFRPEFLKTAGSIGAAIEDLDFATPDSARATINNWVARKTAGHISDLLPSGSIKPDTALVLTNAVYFHGLWRSSFSKDATRGEMFHGVEKNFPVPMMSQTDSFRLYSTSVAKVLEMPFQDTSVVLNLLLPDKGTPMGEFEKTHFTAENLAKWLAKVRDLGERKVLVKVPRFQVGSKLDLQETLSVMGMPLAFSRKADFSGIADVKNLGIDAVAHQATVRMNEDGVVAAAATGATIVPKGIENKEVEFIADRPFLFLLRDRETNTILFIGRVTEPEKGR
jgi:serine protease inhibitor